LDNAPHTLPARDFENHNRAIRFDGGRIVTALSPWLWLVGFAIMVFLTITHFNFIVLLILIFSLPRLFFLFRRKSEEELRYFEVTSAQRWIMAVTYFGLIALLVLGMETTLIPRETFSERSGQASADSTISAGIFCPQTTLPIFLARTNLISPPLTFLSSFIAAKSFFR